MRRIPLQENQGGVGFISHDLVYEADTLQEISEMIMRDENALLEYLNTGKTYGQKAFVFQGFMLLKKPLIAAQITEADI